MAKISYIPEYEKIIAHVDCESELPQEWENYMKQLFELANTLGINGIKVSDLRILIPPNFNPIDHKRWIICKWEMLDKGKS